MIGPDRTTDDGLRLDPEALRSLGLLPRRVDPRDLLAVRCPDCLARVYIHQAERVTLDREEFGGMQLLSLHPCAHPPTAEDLDDPDWGWVDDAR